MSEADRKKKIEELWDKYRSVCDDCGPGNGCDDCRDCPSAQVKFEIYKKIKKLEEK